MNVFQDVKEFQEKMGMDKLPVFDGDVYNDVMKLHIHLIHEEFQEFMDSIGCKFHISYTEGDDKLYLAYINPSAEPVDPVPIADALADLMYVTIGAANALGLDLEPIWKIIHKSNMTKAGGNKDERGKITKPPGWKSPHNEIRTEIERQEKEAYKKLKGDEV